MNPGRTNQVENCISKVKNYIPTWLINKQTRRIIFTIFLRFWPKWFWRACGTTIKYLELLSSPQNCLCYILHTTYSGNETDFLSHHNISRLANSKLVTVKIYIHLLSIELLLLLKSSEVPPDPPFVDPLELPLESLLQNDAQKTVRLKSIMEISTTTDKYYTEHRWFW